jgi:hypothetical protein
VHRALLSIDSRTGEDFGENPIAATVRAMLDQPPTKICEALRAPIIEFTEGASADITAAVAWRV